MKAYTYPGNIYIITGASGTGKSTLLRKLIKDESNLRFSVSHTTRAPRRGERDGHDYHFVNEETFRTMIGDDAFVEHAQVHGHYYGTAKANLTAALSQGVDILVDVDIQGGLQIKKALPSACAIFILPPTFNALRERLEKRNKDVPEVIEKRLRNAAGEVHAATQYDYVLVNDDFETCFAQLKCLVRADRLRPFRTKTIIGRILDTFPPVE